ncbi:hypothetical protein Aca07nite_84690 [Actinoplanes capillaceus]|uniref:TrbL/VirB6 plasmid conjugal transfer protein n=1 Tax=Actinoplanes campanulatus TaxID=113559 RepID=A0ABQ3WYB4_9ACTN|nr:hypothetical protein [Actinoplanes capillaceus]GID51194.1 hypothetical protein Aca07nite_84690 [Actinoplanes capillaceus]
MVNWLANGILIWLLTNVSGAIKVLWNLLVEMVFILPDVTALPQVQAVATNSLMVVNTCFVLAIVGTGVLVMTQHTVQVRYGADELVPRLVIAFVAANFAMPICSQLIVICNSLTQAFAGPLDTSGAFAQLLRITVGSLTNGNERFLILCIGLMIAVLTGMLLVTFIVRTGILVFLVGASPIALACHATPFTDPVAKLWWRSMGGVLGTVTLQALALHTTVDIFLAPDANLAGLGIPLDPTGVFNLLIIACLLWITIRIPGLMRRYVTQSAGGRNAAGMFLRMLVIQQLTSMIRLPLKGIGAALTGRRAAARAAMGGDPNVATTAIPYWRPRMPQTAVPRRPRTTTPPGTSSPAAGPTVPPGVNPATAMPKTRPAWRGGTPAVTPPGTASAQHGTARPVVPPGTNPATAMPKTRPGWRGGTPAATPPGTSASRQGAARPVVPPGTTPGTAMPRSRPTWQNPSRQPPSGGRPGPRRRS